MRRVHWLCAMTLAAAGVLSCDNSAGPSTCGADVGTVEATVTLGGSVVFDWSPACAVALVLVEGDGGDTWLIAGAENVGSADDNVITPPVTYGQAPPAGGDSYGPEPLVAGEEYELILWRVLPAGSNATCLANNGGACLMAVKAFTR